MRHTLPLSRADGNFSYFLCKSTSAAHTKFSEKVIIPSFLTINNDSPSPKLVLCCFRPPPQAHISEWGGSGYDELLRSSARKAKHNTSFPCHIRLLVFISRVGDYNEELCWGGWMNNWLMCGEEEMSRALKWAKSFRGLTNLKWCEQVENVCCFSRFISAIKKL